MSIQLKGFRLSKDGKKIVRDQKKIPVSARLARKGKKKFVNKRKVGK